MMEDVQARKTQIRQSAFVRRDALPKDERSEKSTAIMERLFDFANFLEARIVLFYMSYGSEVDTESMVRKTLELEKKINKFGVKLAEHLEEIKEKFTEEESVSDYIYLDEDE